MLAALHLPPTRAWRNGDGTAAPASLELNLTSAVRLDAQATQCAFWDTHAYFGQESVGAMRANAPVFNRTV